MTCRAQDQQRASRCRDSLFATPTRPLTPARGVVLCARASNTGKVGLAADALGSAPARGSCVPFVAKTAASKRVGAPSHCATVEERGLTNGPRSGTAPALPMLWTSRSVTPYVPLTTGPHPPSRRHGAGRAGASSAASPARNGEAVRMDNSDRWYRWTPNAARFSATTATVTLRGARCVREQ